MSNLDLFPETKPTRAAPRVMMHVCDSGEDRAKFKCGKCGAKSGWLRVRSVTEGKRGIPCAACNVEAS